MAEKLSAAAWNSFAKKRELDDGALVKAFARLDATDDDKHDARLAALDELLSQLDKLVTSLPKRKPPLPDKEAREVKDKLHALIAEAEREQKDTRAAKAQAAEDEEADSPALLTSKMIPLLRELKKGQTQMHALVATAGKSTAVLITRRAIAPARRKLLADYLGIGGGAKYIPADCLLENNAITFVVQSQAAGLAKRLRQALLDQTGLRVKVRVRGDDGGEDIDGEDEDSAAPDGGAPAAPQAATEPADAGPSAAEREWLRRWPPLLARVEQALRAVPRHANANKLQALFTFARDKAERQRDHAAGLRALDQIEPLLADPAQAPAPPGPAAPPAAEPGGRTIAPAIVYTQTRLVWVATRGKLQAELKKLEDAILEHYKGHAVLPEVAKNVRKLDQVLAMFDESLLDNLDNALNAADPEEKARWHDEARRVIARYQGFLANDPLVKELDANPFVPIAVASTLGNTLGTLAAKIV